MGYRFLIIDDSNLVRKMLIKTITLSELEIDTILEASNGSEALAMLDTSSVDLIFLDVNMPVMNGIEFMERLRSDVRFLQMPVVIVSTEGSRERKAQLADREVKAYLRKPVTPELIRETVRNIFGA